MIILNFLENIFRFLLPVALTISAIDGGKRIFSNSSENDTEREGAENKNNTSGWEKKVKYAIVISAIALFIVGIVFIILNMKKLYWLILFLGLPTYLERITGTYQSFGIVEKVVKSSDTGKLSFKERTAINTLAYALWFLGLYQIFEKAIEKIAACSNAYLSDIIIVLIYVVAFYSYIFFICSLLPGIIFSTIKLLKKIYEVLPWKTKIKSWGDLWIDKIDKPIGWKSVLIWQWKTIGEWKFIVRWIWYLLLPITFILDIILLCVNALVSFMSSAVGYIFVLARMIKKTLNRISNWILGLSDKRIVAISFRIGIILALVLVVILNRYQPIFKIGDANTAILEFVASAIIIPVVFEWISSIKSNKSSSENKSKEISTEE